VPSFERSEDMFWMNKKFLIGWTILNFILIAFSLFMFFTEQQSAKETAIWGAVMILSTGLNFMDLEKLKKGDRT
jgi:hypothetical protein